MKKILSFFFTFLLISSTVFAKEMKIIQVSETRFSEKNDNAQLQELIKSVNKQKNVKFVVFTGDNISSPNQETLKEFLTQLKKLKYPYYLIIGEKDVNKNKGLSKIEYSKIVQKNIRKYKPKTTNYSFVVENLAFIVIDGSKDVIPSSNGFYKKETIEWLQKELKLYKNNNIIILQHFPLIPPANKETYITYKPETLLEIINNNKNIKAVISGHFGINKEFTQNGVTFISSPSFPKYKIIEIMDYETDNPTFWSIIKEI